MFNQELDQRLKIRRFLY